MSYLHTFRWHRLPASQTTGRVGVTLVEMLVVVALTVLLMSIVAEVFVLASETLSTLRSASDLNHTTRLIEPIIRQDLENRTIRTVQPPFERRHGWFVGPDGLPGKGGFDDDGNGTNDDVGEIGPGPGPDGIAGNADDSDDVRIQMIVPIGIDPGTNLGYFMIEENAPADEQAEDTDDVLAFTGRLSEASRVTVGGIAAAYYGVAIVGSEPDQAFSAANDGLAGSREAEIVYFLRRGTLYRRVLLVGVPQPSSSSFSNGNAWHQQYDVSARPPLVAGGVPIVNTLGDLSYRSTRFGHRPPIFYTTGIASTLPVTLPGLGTDFPGDALFRKTGYSASALAFKDDNGDYLHDIRDHNNNYPPPADILDVYRELWFGRPTLRETSSPNFDHPNWPPMRPNPTSTLWANPYNKMSAPWNADYHDSASSRYFENLDATATRVAEDVLLTNVLSFDVKVWDEDGTGVPAATYGSTSPPAGAYVDLGRFSNPAASSAPTDYSYLVPGPYPSSGSPYGFPGVDLANLQPTGSYAAPQPVLPVGFYNYPRPNTWPPERPYVGWGLEAEPTNSPRIGGYRRGFGEPFGSRLANGQVNNSANSAASHGSGLDYSAYAIRPGITSILPYGMLRAPAAMARTYDTWCAAYTKPTAPNYWNDGNNNGAIDSGELSPVVPVAPPYIVPLRGIQIKVRFVDPDTRLTREITIVQELQ